MILTSLYGKMEHHFFYRNKNINITTNDVAISSLNFGGCPTLFDNLYLQYSIYQNEKKH